MRKKQYILVAFALVGVAGSALAVKVGEPLYIRAKNTKLMAGTSPTAQAIAVLQPGQKVIWAGSSKENRQWHQVTTAAGKKGVIFQSNLSPTPPKGELIAGAGGQEQDPHAFASSGAATKALGDGAVEMAKKQGKEQSAAQLCTLEAIAQRVSDEAAAAHAKNAGLYAAVGGKP